MSLQKPKAVQKSLKHITKQLLFVKYELTILKQELTISKNLIGHQLIFSKFQKILLKLFSVNFIVLD